MKSNGKELCFSVVALLLPTQSYAHPFRLPSDSIGFFSGLADPFTSADHLLAMLATGFWIYQVARPLAYFLPILFVGLMLMGGISTLIPIEIAYADKVLYISVALVGLMLVSGYTVPLPLGVLIVGIFAFFHGYIHAFDMLLGIETVMYSTGFAIGALLLMATGFAMKWLFVRVFDRDIDRFLGGGDK